MYCEIEARSAREYVQPSMLAPAAAFGDMEQAIAIARRAVDDKDPLFVLLARTWPSYDQLQVDSPGPRRDQRVAPARLAPGTEICESEWAEQVIRRA